MILISLDTCRSDSLGFMGATRKTPRLDRMAEGALVFEDCFAQSSVTGPSHMSILTGQYVQRHGVLKNGVSGNPLYTIASLLKDVGYRTAAFTGHGSFQSKFGHGVGFDQFVSVTSSAEEIAYQRNLADTIPEAQAWLDENADQGPFFLLVHGYDPHLPYWPDEPERSQFGGWYQGDLDPENLSSKYEFRDLIEAGMIGEAEKRYMRDLYDAEVLQADALLGGFIDDLEARGLLENSVVVFTSDHGELLGEHKRIGHGLFFQEVTSVPLFFHFPGQAWAGRSAAPVEHVDIVPTLLSYLGLELPAGLQGHDLMPLALGEEALPANRIRVGQFSNQHTLIAADEPNLKILFYMEEEEPVRVQVYDLALDPGERRNLNPDPLKQKDKQPKFAPGSPERLKAERALRVVARFMALRSQSMTEDAAYRGEVSEVKEEDMDMLEALGYIESGEDED